MNGFASGEEVNRYCEHDVRAMEELYLLNLCEPVEDDENSTEN